MSFTINHITQTKKTVPPKLVLVGPGKIGKTTFASQAPNAVGILTEDGASAVDAQAFPLCSSLNDVYNAMGVLINEPHDFKTVFIDSLDWMEPMLHAYVCANHNWSSIEAPAYGKGYAQATLEWRRFLNGLDMLRAKRNMGIILIAHEKIKRVDSPMTESYDTYTLKLHDKATSLILEWADILGYCSHKILTRTTDIGFGQKENKAITTGERILHVEPHPSHMGGNRFGLTNMDLNWATFAHNYGNY